MNLEAPRSVFDHHIPAHVPHGLRVALEANNLNLSAGTGIATYAATLAGALRDIGHSPLGILGVRTRLSKDNDFLNEVQLYDARQSLRQPVRQFLRSARYGLFGDPLGAGGRKLTFSGRVYGASPALTSGLFEATYGVPHLSLRADAHFRRYGRLLRLKGVGRPEIFHATQPIALSVGGVPNMYTVHDIIPLRLPYATLTDKRQYHDLLSLLAKRADKIVTVSEFSKADIIQAFGVPEQRIVNTYQSVTLPPHLLALPEDQVADALRNGFGLGYKDYFLFVGAIEPKKNVKRLIAGYAASGTQRPLVLAGGLGWQFEDDVTAIEDERFKRYRLAGDVLRPERSVRHLDYVSRSDLVLLLRGARALVFPSLYEGFGLPVLEAMLAGTPVITSRVSSLPEVAGEAAQYVNPFEAESIGRAIRRLDRDDERCAELVALGSARADLFSPARYRERLAALYAALR